MDRELFDFLGQLPGFPREALDQVASVDAPATGPTVPTSQVDAGLYGSPGTYENQTPASPISVNVERNDRGQIQARETQAGIIRSMEDDYQARFVPIEDRMASEIRGGAGLDQDLARTRRAVVNASENVTGQRRRAMSRFGVADRVDPDRKTDTVSNAVGAARDTRMRVEDRRLGLLGGSVSTANKAKNEFGG